MKFRVFLKAIAAEGDSPAYPETTLGYVVHRSAEEAMNTWWQSRDPWGLLLDLGRSIAREDLAAEPAGKITLNNIDHEVLVAFQLMREVRAVAKTLAIEKLSEGIILSDEEEKEALRLMFEHVSRARIKVLHGR